MEIKHQSMDAVINELYQKLYDSAGEDLRGMKEKVDQGIENKKKLRALTQQIDQVEKSIKSATSTDTKGSIGKLKELLAQIKAEFPDSPLAQAASLENTKDKGITDDKNDNGKVDWYYTGDKKDAAWEDYLKGMKDAAKGMEEGFSDIAAQDQLTMNERVSTATRAQQAQEAAATKLNKAADAVAGGLRG